MDRHNDGDLRFPLLVGAKKAKIGTKETGLPILSKIIIWSSEEVRKMLMISPESLTLLNASIQYSLFYLLCTLAQCMLRWDPFTLIINAVDRTLK